MLVDRNPALAFFGGYQAFPGGTLEPEDDDLPIRNLPTSDDGLGEDFPSFVAAAARELFEETGVWLGRGSTSAPVPALGVDRRKMMRGELSFRDILRSRDEHLDARDFTPLCRITTPPFTPRRYDTWFLGCRLPHGAEIEILPGELEGGGFVRPEVALGQWREGEVLIVPPVLFFLQELARAGNASESPEQAFVDRVRQFGESYDQGNLHRVYFAPGVLLAALKTPTKPPATHTNTYLVGHEKLYVIDPAPIDGSEQAKLWNLMDDLIDEGKSLAGILLTHYHPDHVGAVAECQRRYGLPVQAHHDTVSELDGIDFGEPLVHGQELDLGISPDGRPGWKLKAYHVPGHAPGHLAFQESRYETLLVGDLISTISSILVDPTDGHLATYLESLEFLESVAKATVCPGHGPPARDGRKAIQAQIRHRRRREGQLLAALAHGPQSVETLVGKVYTDVDQRMLGLAARSLLSGLIKLQEEGRVQETPTGYCLTPTREAG
jgi:glyoxylase-like metal-dependent hydrolase (beta-lactamase superfamily II)/8-oxo-dGTP pyrophosphatase MutT (NUDIX family)